jgi:hypothetical protein
MDNGHVYPSDYVRGAKITFGTMASGAGGSRTRRQTPEGGCLAGTCQSYSGSASLVVWERST